MLRGEYFVLALTALLGVFVLVSANSLLTVYIGVELLALSRVRHGRVRSRSGIAAESAMKYFVLGAIASGTLLYGMSHDLRPDRHADARRARRDGSRAQPSLGVILGLVFIVVAVAFKLGAVPFHMWLPDVYTARPPA